MATSGSGSGGPPSSAPGPSTAHASKNAGIPADQCRNTACATRAAGKKFTPQLREGPLGPATLCNSCGIRWRREVLRKEQEAQERAVKAAAVAPRHVSVLPPGAPQIPVVVYQEEDDYSESEASGNSDGEGQPGPSTIRPAPGSGTRAPLGTAEGEDATSPASHRRTSQRASKAAAISSEVNAAAQAASPPATGLGAPAIGSTGRTQHSRQAASIDIAKPASMKGASQVRAHGSHTGQQGHLRVEVGEVHHTKVEPDVAAAPATTPATADAPPALAGIVTAATPAQLVALAQPSSTVHAFPGSQPLPQQPPGTQEALPAALTAVAGMLSSISGAFLAMVEFMHTQGSQHAPGQGQEGTHATAGHVNVVGGPAQAIVPHSQYSTPFQPPTPASSAQQLLNMATAALPEGLVMQGPSAAESSAMHGPQGLQPSAASAHAMPPVPYNRLAPVSGPMHVLSTTTQLLQQQLQQQHMQYSQLPQLTAQGMQPALDLAQLLLARQQPGLPHSSLHAMLPPTTAAPPIPVPVHHVQSAAAAASAPAGGSRSPMLASTAAAMLLSLQHASEHEQRADITGSKASGKRAAPGHQQANLDEPATKRHTGTQLSALGQGTFEGSAFAAGLRAGTSALQGPAHAVAHVSQLHSLQASRSAQPPHSQPGYVILQQHPHMAHMAPTPVPVGSIQPTPLQGSVSVPALLGPSFLLQPGLGMGPWATQQPHPLLQPQPLGGERGQHGSSGSSTAAQSPPIPAHPATATVESCTNVPTYLPARASSSHGRRRRGGGGPSQMPEAGQGTGACGSDRE